MENYIHQPEVFLTLLLAQDVGACVCLANSTTAPH